MKVAALRSPRDQVRGIVHFGRMLDKFRLQQSGKLPSEYQQNLGGGFDERCLTFLSIKYPALIDRVKQGGSDEEILEWCFREGRHPSEQEIEVWNGFMSKRGWNDDSSELLQRRLKESGFEGRSDIQTFFDFIDLDEGRDPRGLS